MAFLNCLLLASFLPRSRVIDSYSAHSFRNANASQICHHGSSVSSEFFGTKKGKSEGCCAFTAMQKVSRAERGGMQQRNIIARVSCGDVGLHFDEQLRSLSTTIHSAFHQRICPPGTSRHALENNDGRGGECRVTYSGMVSSSAQPPNLLISALYCRRMRTVSVRPLPAAYNRGVVLLPSC